MNRMDRIKKDFQGRKTNGWQSVGFGVHCLRSVVTRPGISAKWPVLGRRPEGNECNCCDGTIL